MGWGGVGVGGSKYFIIKTHLLITSYISGISRNWECLSSVLGVFYPRRHMINKTNEKINMKNSKCSGENFQEKRMWSVQGEGVWHLRIISGTAKKVHLVCKGMKELPALISENEYSMCGETAETSGMFMEECGEMDNKDPCQVGTTLRDLLWVRM